MMYTMLNILFNLMLNLYILSYLFSLDYKTLDRSASILLYMKIIRRNGDYATNINCERVFRSCLQRCSIGDKVGNQRYSFEQAQLIINRNVILRLLFICAL